MFTLTIKELAARKVRLLTTAFAVLLGVAFMAGTLVFTDTIRATYDSALALAPHRSISVRVRRSRMPPRPLRSDVRPGSRLTQVARAY